MSPEEYKAILAKYMPAVAVDSVYDFMSRHNVHLHITRKRTSKLGDYRWPQSRHNYHEISVNGDMNPYHFLMVLLHEMAHLNTYQRYGSDIQPHGHEWQEHYRRLLMTYSREGHFPEAVRPLLGDKADGFWGKLIDIVAIFAIVCATATTCRLVISYNDHIARTVFLHPAIRRVCLINMYDFPFHVAKVQKKIVLLHHGREK